MWKCESTTCANDDKICVLTNNTYVKLFDGKCANNCVSNCLNTSSNACEQVSDSKVKLLDGSYANSCLTNNCMNATSFALRHFLI